MFVDSEALVIVCIRAAVTRLAQYISAKQRIVRLELASGIATIVRSYKDYWILPREETRPLVIAEVLNA